MYGQSPFYDNKNPPEHTIKTPWRVIFVNLKWNMKILGTKILTIYDKGKQEERG